MTCQAKNSLIVLRFETLDLCTALKLQYCSATYLFTTLTIGSFSLVTSFAYSLQDSFDSRRGKSVDSDVRSRGASSNLSPRSRALKHLQLKTLGNHNLLTSSSYDLRTSFSSTNQGSLIGFRKSASLSALNKDRCLTGTTTTTDSSERRSNIDLGSRSSKYSRSTDRRSLTCSAPRSIVSEDFSANIGYSYSSLFLENPFDSEKSSFFAHRPTLLPSDHNDLFLKRLDSAY